MKIFHIRSKIDVKPAFQQQISLHFRLVRSKKKNRWKCIKKSWEDEEWQLKYIPGVLVVILGVCCNILWKSFPFLLFNLHTIFFIPFITSRDKRCVRSESSATPMMQENWISFFSPRCCVLYGTIFVYVFHISA